MRFVIGEGDNASACGSGLGWGVCQRCALCTNAQFLKVRARLPLDRVPRGRKAMCVLLTFLICTRIMHLRECRDQGVHALLIFKKDTTL